MIIALNEILVNKMGHMHEGHIFYFIISPSNILIL